jgi:DNA-directed RNA polymerase subunit RPC12/RpoP
LQRKACLRLGFHFQVNWDQLSGSGPRTVRGITRAVVTGGDSNVETLTSKTEASFYCNRCDRWVDGIEDNESRPAAGIRQVLCDECGSAILYRPPSLWRKLQRTASQFLGNAFASRKK